MEYVGVDIGKYAVYLSILENDSSLSGIYTIRVESKNDIDRTHQIFGYLNEYFNRLDKDNTVVAVEGPVYSLNIKTTTDIHRNIVAVELAACEAGIPVFQYDNRTWKRMVLGNGKASKEDIAKFFDVRWKDDDTFKSVSCQDEKDAACIALHQYLLMSKGNK